MSETVNVAEIRSAADLVSAIVRHTPLEPARDPGVSNVFLKCENVQRAGSFKIRGAYNRIANLSAEQKKRGVVAASAGNHAQGVALAAEKLGTKATVFMPEAAPLPKVAATKGYGAEVVLTGHSVDEALVSAHRFASETGAELIHPFDHPDIVAGQGTCGLEILHDLPDVQTIVVSLGGGGLLAGIAIAAKAMKPDVKIVGVQASEAAAWPESLKAGQPTPVGDMHTIADGIAVGRPGAVPFEYVSQYVDEVITVSEEDITRALLSLLERNKLVVEPAGATAYAAIHSGAIDPLGPTAAVLSGGNIDPLLLMRLIEHGLSATGRFLRINVRCPDRPGNLGHILQVIGEHGGNVVDVAHMRSDPSLGIGEVSIDISIETRGPDHARDVADTLRAHDYHVSHA
ncbi:threonine ammonia-lyase [Haloglycomyces albus]|uniref:threonine ammonia-lyase n=1 Tax=Haloglycomyces albus TaxID=526067 RepID=UPI00046C8E30|nr:threonine ammonia-lyase [Haloglycomyces albus]